MDDRAGATTVEPQQGMTSELTQRRPRHPALARLHDRLVGAKSQQITSYDRMHHRHNRS
jgi:hypothetical protein